MPYHLGHNGSALPLLHQSGHTEHVGKGSLAVFLIYVLQLLSRVQLFATPWTAAHQAPPSTRAEGLLFLHGLESNPGSSLQTEEEAGLP